MSKSIHIKGVATPVEPYDRLSQFAEWIVEQSELADELTNMCLDIYDASDFESLDMETHLQSIKRMVHLSLITAKMIARDAEYFNMIDTD